MKYTNKLALLALAILGLTGKLQTADLKQAQINTPERTSITDQPQANQGSFLERAREKVSEFVPAMPELSSRQKMALGGVALPAAAGAAYAGREQLGTAGNYLADLAARGYAALPLSMPSFSTENIPSMQEIRDYFVNPVTTGYGQQLTAELARSSQLQNALPAAQRAVEDAEGFLSGAINSGLEKINPQVVNQLTQSLAAAKATRDNLTEELLGLSESIPLTQNAFDASKTRFQNAYDYLPSMPTWEGTKNFFGSIPGYVTAAPSYIPFREGSQWGSLSTNQQAAAIAGALAAAGALGYGGYRLYNRYRNAPMQAVEPGVPAMSVSSTALTPEQKKEARTIIGTMESMITKRKHDKQIDLLNELNVETGKLASHGINTDTIVIYIKTISNILNGRHSTRILKKDERLKVKETYSLLMDHLKTLEKSL